MVFSSVEFLLFFLPVFILLYWLSPDKWKNIILVAGSLLFYAYRERKYFLLLIFSLCVNYLLGLCLGVRNRYFRGAVLILAVAANVSGLLFFKVGHSTLGLPLGISFYTFQILSYLIDVYRGDIRSEKSLLNMAVYVTMFPKLLSGPIASYDELQDQLTRRKISPEGIQDGLKIFTLGLVLKVLIADRVGLLWYDVQVTGFESISTMLAWLAAFAYSMEIYFDFFGYSLMAVGLGRMLGFSLPRNFRTPYMARSVRDFYRRWHMTLGRWFTRYVYIPLGGSYGETLQTIRNLLVVWVLTSLWHGNSANFLLWGLFLWCCIVMERFAARLKIGEYFTIFPHLYLWLVIPVSWMCFAITDVGELGVYLGRMFGLAEGINVRPGDWQSALQKYGVLLLIAVAGTTPLLEKVFRKLSKHMIGTAVLAVLFWICIQRLILEGNNPFMYFNY